MKTRWMASAILLLLLTVQWTLAAKRSNGGPPSASPANRPRTTTTTSTTTTPSSIIPEEWRDPYVYSLFEITLSAIDSKLKRVDTLERAMETVMLRLAENTARSDAILAQLRSMESSGCGASGNIGGIRTPGSAGASFSSIDNLEPRILALDEKVSLIGSKLNVLTYQLDSNSLLWAGLSGQYHGVHNANDTSKSHDDYAGAGSEPARAYIHAPRRPDRRADRQNADQQWSTNRRNDGGDNEGESIRSTMASMDRHLKILIELFSEQMDKMMGAVADVRTAVINHHALEVSIPTEPSIRGATGNSNAKLDVIVQKMTPLLDVSEKVDQVWNVLMGAKSSVDALVPTSEALLWQTQRQERALTEIHTELNVKAKQIIDNLNQVERQLLQVQRESSPGNGGSLSKRSKTNHNNSNSNNSNKNNNDNNGNQSDEVLASKPQESQQVQVTFGKQPLSAPASSSAGGLPTSRTVATVIRAQELSPGPVVAAVLATATATAKPSTSTTGATMTTTLPPPLQLPPEVVPIPSDIMDSEFLHDEPVSIGNQTVSATSTTSSANSTTRKTTSATGANANVTTTTSRSVLLQQIAPAGPTERSRIPTNSAVIFPSLKNKPGFTNSTFFYDYTTPQNISGYSCAELKEQGLTKSGIYYLLIRGTSFWYIKVYCDMEEANGGWTVIQRRDDYGGDNRENFNRDWDDYKSGFGDPDREFWLGNENIYMLTNAEDYSLRVELEDFEGNKRYAEYSSFKLYSEREQYKLEIGGYTGNAGDSLNDPWYGSNLSPFSTYNRDNDRSSLNCASMLKGGWWWKSCGRGLNGIYLTDPQDLTARQGIVWFRWRGWDYTLKRATMMIRPRHYGKEPSTPSPDTKTN